MLHEEGCQSNGELVKKLHSLREKHCLHMT